ncbi:MAG: hypothetical protein R3176_01780 [Woeseiaceae bacterium]|nr:hypothetical protein [Woeseiaceae bacterium]
MHRSAVFGLRLLPTAAILGVIVGAVYGLWYPGGHAGIAGVGVPVLVLAGVAVVLGPVLSAVVYRPGKPGLAADLAVLAVLEFGTVAVLASLLCLRQPAYLVFAVDRFEVVSRGEVDPDAFVEPGLARRPAHAPRLIHARMPADPEAFDRLLDETVLMGLPDIDRRPEFWEPYATALPLVLAKARPLGDLLGPGDPRRAAVSRWLGEQSAAAADFRFLPVRGRRADGIMVLHARVGFPVAVLQVEPWE